VGFSVRKVSCARKRKKMDVRQNEANSGGDFGGCKEVVKEKPTYIKQDPVV